MSQAASQVKMTAYLQKFVEGECRLRIALSHSSCVFPATDLRNAIVGTKWPLSNVAPLLEVGLQMTRDWAQLRAGDEFTTLLLNLS